MAAAQRPPFRAEVRTPNMSLMLHLLCLKDITVMQPDAEKHIPLLQAARLSH